MKKILIALIISIAMLTPAFSQDFPTEIGNLLQKYKDNISSKDITVYIKTEIGEPSLYNDLIYLLDNAEAGQIIRFNINSPGGDVLATLDITNAMRRSKAHLIANVQFAASAASWIALACDEVIVERYAIMMIHSMRGGMSGTPQETLLQSEVFNKLNADIIRNAYKNFLSEKEIENVINGSVIWLYEDEIKKRLKK